MILIKKLDLVKTIVALRGYADVHSIGLMIKKQMID